MKIKVKDQNHYISVLSELGFNVKNLPANAHSLYVYGTKTVFSGIKQILDANNYDTTGLEFDDEGRIIFK